MNANKVCFIHVRPNTQNQAPNEASHLLAKGGFTVAWKITDAGDIILGRPAICIGVDHYEKAIGRDIATKNLTDLAPIVTIPASAIASFRATIPAAMMHPDAPFSKAGKDRLLALLTELSNENPLENLSSNFYERLVQNQFRVDQDEEYFSIMFRGGDGFTVKLTK